MAFDNTNTYTPPTGAENAFAGKVIASAVWNAVFTDIANNGLTLVGQASQFLNLYCTSAGTNAVVLTLVSAFPAISAYANGQKFTFKAPNNSSGSVTIKVGALAALKAFATNGTTQIGSGDLISGQYYEAVYLASLDSAAGGFVIGAGAIDVSFAIGVLPPAHGGTGIANGNSSTLTISGSFGTTLTVTAATALTLPVGPDTLIGKATTDALTNKTFNTAATGNVLQINGTGITAITGSGSVVLATSPSLTTPSLGAATATTINGITISASTGTLALNTNQLAVTGVGQVLALGGPTGTITFQGTDTYVGRATTDTLTNKTYDTAGTGNAFKLSGTTVTTASTILDIIGSTQGDILYRNAANWTVLAPGTSGQFLQTLGAGANPVWQTGSGATTSGNRTLLNTLTASTSASLADTTSLTSTFSRYELVFENIVPATNAVICRLRYNVGGVQTTGYLASTFAAATAASAVATTTTYIPVSRQDTATLSSTASNGGLSGVVLIEDPSNATRNKFTRGEMVQWDTALTNITYVAAYGTFNTNQNAVTGFEVTMSAGNITSGTIKVFGIVN